MVRVPDKSHLTGENTMKYISMMLCTTAFLFAASSAADARTFSTPDSGCQMVENVTMSVQFNGTEGDIRTVTKHVDDAEQKSLTYAKKLGIGEVTVTSRSYNIYPQNSNLATTYQYNGTIGLKLPSTEKAADLIEMLAKDKIQAQLNVNSYQQGNCQ